MSAAAGEGPLGRRRGPRVARARRLAVAAALLAAAGRAAWALPAPPGSFAAAARTPLVMTLAGRVTVNGGAAPSGTEVAAYDSRGMVCGASGVDADHGGAYLLHVYGDDPTTAAADGAPSGEALRVAVYWPATGRVYEGASVRLVSSTLGPPAAPAPLLFADRTAWTLDLEVSVPGDDTADADADGVGDASDDFPHDPAASLDTDGDGRPDAWNPGRGPADSTTGLVLDDFPQDPGQWFDPLRHRPVTPRILTLASAPAAPLTTFFADLSGFSDPDGDAMAGLEWQIAEVDPATGGLLANAFAVTQLATAPPAALEVPQAVLGAWRTYEFALRYRDATGLWSEFSPAARVATPADPLDLGGQPGVQDDVEAPQTMPGTVLFRDPATASLLGVRAPAGVVVERLYVTDAADVPAQALPPGELPYGLFGISLGPVPVGASIEVTFSFPAPLPEGSRWVKLGAGGAAEDYTARTRRGEDGASVAVALTDGGAGDADGVANGRIVDPGGPLVVEGGGGGDGSGSGGGGGGCFVGAAGVDAPGRGQAAPQGVAATLLVFAAMAARRAGRLFLAAASPAAMRRRFWEKSS